MSYTIRFKLSAAEHREVLRAASALGIDPNALAYQALAYTLSRAREMGRQLAAEQGEQSKPTSEEAARILEERREMHDRSEAIYRKVQEGL